MMDKAKAISQIRALLNECSAPGWDGDSANPLTPRTAGQAVQFIRALPDKFALPEFAPEPDGSLALDWIDSRNRLFSLSIGTSKRLAYTWLDGTDKGHAVARFDESSISPRILQGISAIMGHENVAVGFGGASPMPSVGPASESPDDFQQGRQAETVGTQGMQAI